MTYEIRFREEAENDLAEAAAWYQRQQAGLGHEFLDEVFSLLQSIQERPLSYPTICREIRRAITLCFAQSTKYTQKQLSCLQYYTQVAAPNGGENAHDI